MTGFFSHMPFPVGVLAIAAVAIGGLVIAFAVFAVFAPSAPTPARGPGRQVLEFVGERPVAVAAGIAGILFLAMVAVFDESRWYALLYDDAFFYIKTASMAAQGGGFTFDGVNPTNGFHPLYLFLLTVVAWVRPLAGVPGIITVAAVDLCLWIWFAAALRRFAAALGLARNLQALAVFAALPLTAVNDFGLESRLFLPLVFTALAALAEGRRRGGTGLLLAAVFLSRIDALLLIVLVVGAVLIADRRQGGGTDPAGLLVPLLGPVLGAAAAYAAVNLSSFGHPTSISSWLKFGWPGTFETGWLWATSPGFKLRMLVCSVGALAYLVAGRARRTPGGPGAGAADVAPRTDSLALLAALNLFTILYFAVLLFFARSGIYGWYFALPMTTLSITLLWLLRARAEGWGTALNIALLAGCMVAAGADIVRRTRLPDPELPAMAARLREKTPPDARILMVDVSGKMGYASERAIVNGDGLINGWEYQDALRTGRLAEYLRRHDIDRVICHWYYDQERPQILIPLWHGPRPYAAITFAEPVRPALREGRFALFPLLPGRFAAD